MRTFFAFSILLCILAASAFSLTVTSGGISCEYGCLPGHEFTPSYNVDPVEDWSYIYYIELREEDGSLLCTKTIERNITKLTTYMRACDAEIPEDEEGTWIFDACFNYEDPDTGGEAITDCFASSVDLDEEECGDDGDCADDEECKYEQCAEVECYWCQYVEDHKCVPYECCMDEQCLTGEYCLDNVCILECEDGIAVDHQCIPYECENDTECPDGEICSERFCGPLNCSEGVPYIHECVECVEDGDCADDEHCSENSCIPVECPEGDVVSHVCVPPEAEDEHSTVSIGGETPPEVSSPGSSAPPEPEKKLCPFGFVLAALAPLSLLFCRK